MTLTFATPGTSASRSYIDLSQVASLVNRRFYRQGINWAVAGFKVTSLKAGAVNIFKLPNTWVMSNAWEKGFRAWQKMNREALAEAPSVRPKFLDFKIYADAEHHQAGFGANLMPLSGAGVAATAGEWVASKYVVPDAPGGTVNNFEVLATGASFPPGGASGLGAVSLIEGYANSRGLPYTDDPNVPDDVGDAAGPTPENWLSALFNEGTSQDDQVLDDMRTENDQAPYPFENDGIHNDTMYPGGETQLAGLEYHDFVQIYETNVSNGVGIQRMKGGNFPCGLICVDWNPTDSANLVIQIDLIPGHHRGYLCEKMGDM